MRIRSALLLLLLLLQPLAASAAVTNLQVERTDPAVLPGFTSNDLRIDFDGGLRGQQLVVQLTAGSIYQDALGSNTPPNGAFLALAPSLQFDTFVALGGITQQTSYPIILAPGTIVPTCNLEPYNCAVNLAWAPGTGVEIPTGDDFVVARITLSDDASGVVHYSAETATNTGPAISYFASGTIQNGVINFVPEPATLFLAAFLFICLSLHRRSPKCVSAC